MNDGTLDNLKNAKNEDDQVALKTQIEFKCMKIFYESKYLPFNLNFDVFPSLLKS